MGVADRHTAVGDETTSIEALVVSYTVKELLASLNESVARIEAKLDSKADAADVQALQERVSRLELGGARAYGAMVAVGALAGGSGAALSKLFL